MSEKRCAKDREKERNGEKRLTETPSKVLVINKEEKLPMNSNASPDFMLDRSNLWIALKSTTDVASFTTPSPKTKL